MTEDFDFRTELAVSRAVHVDEYALPDDIKRLLRTHHGDNWVQVLAWNPDIASRFVHHLDHFSRQTEGELSMSERELIAGVVCASHACHFANASSDAPDNLDDAGPRSSDLSHREQALADLTLKVIHEPCTVKEDDYEQLRDAGCSDAAILEAVETAAWFNQANRLFISLDVAADDRFFA